MTDCEILRLQNKRETKFKLIQRVSRSAKVDGVAFFESSLKVKDKQ